MQLICWMPYRLRTAYKVSEMMLIFPIPADFSSARTNTVFRGRILQHHVVIENSAKTQCNQALIFTTE